MTTLVPRAERAYDPADLSSTAFWSQTAAERERTFAELRAQRPVSWHRPVENGLFEDPNDQGFWAVVRHADPAQHHVVAGPEGVDVEAVAHPDVHPSPEDAGHAVEVAGARSQVQHGVVLRVGS